MATKKISVAKIIFIVWLVFSTLYVIRGEYNRLTQYVYNSGLKSGIEQTASQIVEKSKNCQALPITVDGQTTQIVNVDCLKKPLENNGNSELSTVSGEQ